MTAEPVPPGLDGVLVVDKPAGSTSHDVVALARKGLGPARVGHTGTLDPMATGVLALCSGRATRLARYLGGEKEYEGTIALGATTDTYDAEGRVLTRSDPSGVTLAGIRSLARELTGDLLQTPPRVSAKRIGGRRAYELAREGAPVTPAPCRVSVSRFEILSLEEGIAVFLVACSGGTYVRSLAHDLGERAGPGAHLASLRRTRSGPFRIDEAIPIARITEAIGDAALPSLLVPLERLDLGLPTALLEAEAATLLVAGRPAPLPREARDLGLEPGALVRVLDGAGRLLGVAESVPSGEGLLQPRVVVAGGARAGLYNGR